MSWHFTNEQRIGVTSPDPSLPSTNDDTRSPRRDHPKRLLHPASVRLGVTRKALSELLNGHSGLSPDMAIRLEQVFGTTADAWLRMQMQRDLWPARQRNAQIRINRSYAAQASA